MDLTQRDHSLALRASKWVLVGAMAATLLLAIGYGIGRDWGGKSEIRIAESEQLSSGTKEVVETGCAVLSWIVDAKFSDGITYQEGDSLPPGRLKLLSGAVQVDFFSGATMLIYYSPPIFNAAGRRWHHVAVTFDSTTGEAVQYFDGKEVSREVSEHHANPSFRSRTRRMSPCGRPESSSVRNPQLIQGRDLIAGQRFLINKELAHRPGSTTKDRKSI